MKIFFYINSSSPTLLIVQGCRVINGNWNLKLHTSILASFEGGGKTIMAHFLMDIPDSHAKGDYRDIFAAMHPLIQAEFAGLRALSSGTKKSNSAETDKLAKVPCIVTLNNRAEIEIMSSDPLAASDEVNQILKNYR